MFVSDLEKIGEKIRYFRNLRGLSQEATAEKSELSYRIYSDIERGKVNTRILTLLKICNVLDITPNDILVEPSDYDISINAENLLSTLSNYTAHEKETACKLLQTYLQSL